MSRVGHGNGHTTPRSDGEDTNLSSPMSHIDRRDSTESSVSGYRSASMGSPTSDQAQSPETVQLCEVCNDMASGRHYDAMTCEGCKGFFRRVVINKTRYQCVSGNGNCKIDTNNRRRCCKFCRYVKCRSVGMNEALVIRPTRRRTSLEGFNVCSDQAEFSELHLMKTNIIRCYEQTIGRLLNSDVRPGGQMDPVAIFGELHVDLEMELVSFVSGVKHLREVPVHDQLVMVQTAIYDVCFLLFCLDYNPIRQEIFIPRRDFLPEEYFKVCPGFLSLAKLILAVGKWIYDNRCTTNKVHPFMVAMLVANPYRAQDQHKDRIIRINDDIMQLYEWAKTERIPEDNEDDNAEDDNDAQRNGCTYDNHNAFRMQNKQNSFQNHYQNQAQYQTLVQSQPINLIFQYLWNGGRTLQGLVENPPPMHNTVNGVHFQQGLNY